MPGLTRTVGGGGGGGEREGWRIAERERERGEGGREGERERARERERKRERERFKSQKRRETYSVDFLNSSNIFSNINWDFWATIPSPTRPRVADSGIPNRYRG